MADRDDLDELERVARAAAGNWPKPWRISYPDTDPFDVCNHTGGMVASTEGAPVEENRLDDARHIAAFCPAVALRLIARLRAAERVVEAAEALSLLPSPPADREFMRGLHRLDEALAAYDRARAGKEEG